MSQRVVLITGGGKGVGRAVGLRLAALGDAVIAVGREQAALEETVALAGGGAGCEQCDVTNEREVAALFARIGSVDVLVNNAGTSSSAPLGRTTLADWEAHLDVNATAAFLCTRAVLPEMMRRDHGRIVTIASTAGLVGSRYTAAYTASKHAAVGLMRSVAAEVAGTGVTANAVCPTFIDTDMTRRSVERIAQTTGRSESDAVAALERASPLGRLLGVAEVAAAVEFLVSEEAAAVNGQTLVLDGGGIQR